MPGAAANRLLDALDSVLNSNSLLLEDSVAADADSGAALLDFFASARFRDLLAQADEDRGWLNYRAPDADHGGTTLDERLYIGGTELSISEIDRQQLRDELVSLLTTTKSPHHKQLPAGDAEALVDTFLDELASDPRAPSNADDWRFYRVAPDFLRSSGYGGTRRTENDTAPAYFDGGAFDRCLVMRRGPALRVLLTNGAP